MRIVNFIRNLFRRTPQVEIHHSPRPLGRRRRDPELPADVSCSRKIVPARFSRRKVA